jgi:ABC-type amino acid transport system permease subunit
LIAVFVAMTIAYALLNWALGAPTGFLGAALAYAWLGAIVTLPVVITVRMWRALPILVRLKKLAIDGPDRDYEALAPAVPSNTTVPLSVQERIAIADASLEPGSDEATRPVKPPP